MRLRKRLGAAVSAVALVGAVTGVAIGVNGAAGAATEPAGGTWAAAQPFPGFSASDATFTAATCPSLGDCVAVGDTYGSAFTPIVGAEVNGVWESSQVLSWPASLGSFGTFTNVSCGGPGDCTAVGWYAGTVAATAFYVSETKGAWGTPVAIISADQPTGTYSQVNGLSCSAVGYCAIVGRYTDQGAINAGLTVSTPFTLDEASGTWDTPQPVPGLASLPSAGKLNTLDSVSCTGTRDCTASGESGGNGFTGRPFVVSETGGAWGNAEQLPGSLSTDDTMISCPDATDCAVAATYMLENYTTEIFTLDEANGVWGQGQTLSMPSSETDIVNNPLLSCRSAGNCVIVDNMDLDVGTSAPTVPFAATETSSGAWGAAAPLPGFQTSTEIGMVQGLSCVPDGDCTIAGTDQADSGGDDSIWTAVSSADGSIGTMQQDYQSAGSDDVYSLSCPQDGYCTAGFDLDYKNMLGTEATASTIGLTVSAAKVTYGAEQSETLTATVTSPAGGTPTGTVAVTDGTTPVCTINLADGDTCSPAATAIPAGTDTLTATYSGDATYVPATSTATVTVAKATASYTPVAPVRVLDTRNGTGGFSSPVGAGKSIALQVTGRDGVPATGVTAVVLNVTATGPTASGYVTAYPDGQARPAAGSNLNFTKGETIPNLVIVPVGSDGKIDLYNSAGTVNLVADLQGYYSTSGGSGYATAGPVRVLDTRNGTGGFSSPVGAGKSIALQVTGRDGVPATGVTAVVLNVTATGPTAASYVTAYPDGQARPAAGSNLNFTKGETIPNLVIVPVGSDGKIDLYNSAGTVNLVADLQGYYSTSGGSGYATAGPVRVLDTRNGTGGFSSPVGAGKSIALQVTGRDGVPATGVTAVVLNVTATGPTAASYVTAYPDGQARPAAGSNLNFTKGETIPNLVIVPVGSDGKIDLYNSAGSVNLVADLFGYYVG